MKVCLPLYSYRGNKVYPSSGLNQWNANGRTRNDYEVYIPIPQIFYSKNQYSSFFPDSETSFKLKFPDGREVNAKICQSQDKALMSDPNSELGRWLIDEVLKVKHTGIITDQDLINANCDSVEIEKIRDGEYTIKPLPLGTFNTFINS